MAFVFADLVEETTATTGTGSYTLAGAAVGFQSFASGIGTTNETFYAVADGTDWEVSRGTLSDATTLTRAEVLASSNGGSAVSWGAGTKRVYAVAPAAFFQSIGTMATQAASSVAITGGAIDGTTIGGTTPTTGVFTTLTVNTQLNAQTITSNAAANINFATSGGTQVVVQHVASTVNNFRFQGSATGSFPGMYVDGADTNIGLGYRTKGTGPHFFYTQGGSAPQFGILHSASTVDYLVVVGSATAIPRFEAIGASADIDIRFLPKGTGKMRFGTHSAIGAETVTGSIEIKDAGGTLRKLAVVS